MDAERPDEITDAALDRELQAMLGVDPSPEFVARARTRIADELSPSRPSVSAWTLAASFVSVAAIVVVAVVVSRDTGGSAPSQPPALDSTSATPSAWTLPDRKGRALGQYERAGARVTRVASQQTALRAVTRQQQVEPEVLVDPREAAALRALIFGTRQGRIDLTPVLAASTPTVMELPPVIDIEIPEIAIEPIAPGTGEEGVRQ
jgi:hypothetical protein